MTEPAAPFSWNQDKLRGLLLIAVTFLVYLPAWHGLPVWDDDLHMTPERLRSLDGLVQAWSLHSTPIQYYPFAHSVFWLQSVLWGDATLGYHLLNISLHVASAIILVGILRKLGIRGAWLAAAVFALHPVMVESVAWISELKNTLSGVCFFSAVLTYLTYTETGRRESYISSLGFFVVGLLAKTMLAPFPLAMLAVMWWKRGKLTWKRDIVPLLPFFLTAALFGVITIYVEWIQIGEKVQQLELSLVERCLIAGRAFWFYLGKLCLPVNLLISYPRWDVNPAVWWQYLLPAAALGMGYVLWARRQRSRAPMAAYLYFVAMLLPCLGFIKQYTFRYSLAADRYQYFAALGPIVLGVGLLEMTPESIRVLGRSLKVTASTVLLLTLGILSWRQSGMYSDAETLYRATIAGNPRSWMAHSNLGMVLATKERTDEALVHFREATALNPGYAPAHYNLGHLLEEMGRTEEARAQYQKALELNPAYADAHNNLGVMLKALGRTDEALAHYRKATDLDPNHAGAQHNLGSLLDDMGQTDEAMAHYEQALKANPNHVETHYNIGLLYAKTGRIDDAMVHYREVLRLNPDHANAHNNLGILFATTERLEDAITHFRKAFEIEPTAIRFLKNFAVALTQKGQVTEATAVLQKALASAKSAGDTARAEQIRQVLSEVRELSNPSQSNSSTLPE